MPLPVGRVGRSITSGCRTYVFRVTPLKSCTYRGGRCRHLGPYVFEGLFAPVARRAYDLYRTLVFILDEDAPPPFSLEADEGITAAAMAMIARLARALAHFPGPSSLAPGLSEALRPPGVERLLEALGGEVLGAGEDQRRAFLLGRR